MEGIRGKMLKRLKPYVLTEEERSDMQLNEWTWNSHNWDEYYPGYFKCLWCGATHTSVQPVGPNFPLCMENPRIKQICYLCGGINET